MDIRRETRYETDPETAFAMLTDENFLRKRAERAHALGHSASVTHGGATTTSVLQQNLPAEVPDFVRKITGPTINLTETIIWSAPGADRSRKGQISLDVAGAPVTMRGSITLALDGTGTRQVVDAVLKAAIPLLGGKIEKEAAPAVIAAIDSMEKISRDWLAQ